MTTAAWNWLPDGAIASPEVLGLVDAAIGRWSQSWFPAWRLQRRGLLFANAPAGARIVASTPKVVVGALNGAVDAMVSRVMDEDITRLELGDGDHAILDALTDELFRDLARELDVALAGEEADEPSGAPDVSGAVLIDLTDEDGRKVLWVETSRKVLASARHMVLPASTAGPAGQLVSLRSAIGETPVALSATVGSVIIPLPEARKLAPGDVIVLDRRLDQAIDLVAASGGTRVACATLVDAASPRSLRLESAASRDRR